MFIRLQTSSGIPITRQIGDQIRTSIASGTLHPGEKLPSVRELAKELTVNQNTILRVYERLTFEGLLERRHGDGTYVAQKVPSGQMETQRAFLKEEVARLTEKARALGITKDELRRMVDQAMRATHLEAKS